MKLMNLLTLFSFVLYFLDEMMLRVQNVTSSDSHYFNMTHHTMQSQNTANKERCYQDGTLVFVKCSYLLFTKDLVPSYNSPKPSLVMSQQPSMSTHRQYRAI